MFIDTEVARRQALQRSAMFACEDSPQNIAVLRSGENFMEHVDYKHFVPPGLVVSLETLLEKMNRRTCYAGTPKQAQRRYST